MDPCRATGGLFWDLFNIFANGQIVDGNKLGYNFWFDKWKGHHKKTPRLDGEMNQQETT